AAPFGIDEKVEKVVFDPVSFALKARVEPRRGHAGSLLDVEQPGHALTDIARPGVAALREHAQAAPMRRQLLDVEHGQTVRRKKTAGRRERQGGKMLLGNQLG